MDRSRRLSSKTLSAPPRQINIAFESRWLQGLTFLERERALTYLANLLMQAAGLGIEEHNDEFH